MADGITENGSRHHFFLNVKYAQVEKPDMTKQLVSGHHSGNSDYLCLSLIPKYLNNPIFSTGSTQGDTIQADASPPSQVQAESLSPDSGYYNYAPYPSSYPCYDYDDVYAATSQDRQDVGLLGGVGAGVILTAFAAAFLGSLIAPAISVGVGRVMNMEFRLPELPFRALRYGKLICIQGIL